MFNRLIGDQWMDEVTRRQGGLLELWGSLEDTHRGHSTPEKAHCVPCNTFGEQREIYEWIRLFFKPP